MWITEVKKKRYNLTVEEISAIRLAIDVLETISNDDEIYGAIYREACGAIVDAQDVLSAILNLDKTNIDY